MTETYFEKLILERQFVGLLQAHAEVFFRRALERKVLTVPGRFFDVNPRQQRSGESPFRSWMRFSFGPTEANVRTGLERLEAMLGGR